MKNGVRNIDKIMKYADKNNISEIFLNIEEGRYYVSKYDAYKYQNDDDYVLAAYLKDYYPDCTVIY